MSYCWRFIVSKNRLQCNSTKIPHGYWRQANLFVSITIRTDLPGILLPMRLRNDLSFSKKAIFHFVKKNGKISAQPYPTKCIQFLDRENNEKNNTLPLGKQICFSIVWGCAEILPSTKAPVGISCRVLNANLRLNAYIIALVGEPAVLKIGSFISPFTQKQVSSTRLFEWCCASVCYLSGLRLVRTRTENFYGKQDLPTVFIFTKSSINVHLIAFLSRWTKGGRTFSRWLINVFAGLSSSHRVPELWHPVLL